MDTSERPSPSETWINELLHRITMANTQAVRMQLCAEIKREIAAYLDQAKGGV